MPTPQNVSNGGKRALNRVFMSRWLILYHLSNHSIVSKHINAGMIFLEIVDVIQPLIGSQKLLETIPKTQDPDNIIGIEKYLPGFLVLNHLYRGVLKVIHEINVVFILSRFLHGVLFLSLTVTKSVTKYK